MKIRVEGTLRELDEATDKLRSIYHIVSKSEPYKNRNSELHRIYLEVREEDHIKNI